MLMILIPIAAMLAGLIAGIYIGICHRGLVLAGGSHVRRSLGFVCRSLRRGEAIGRTIASRTWSDTRRLGHLARALCLGAWNRIRSLRSPATLPGRGRQRVEKLRQCLDHVKLPSKTPRDSANPAPLCEVIDTAVLNCRTRIGREPDGDSWRSVLILDLCGTIESPEEGYEVCLEVSIHDVTDDPDQPMPVLNRSKQGPIQGGSHFVFQTDMGKLCHRTTVLEDWTSVGQISPEWFVLPRQGRRNLRFSVSIISRETGARLATATCVTPYENIEIGYLDVEDNIQRAKTLAVGLAFSVAAAKDEVLETEIDVIFGWVRTNFGSGDASTEARHELERALQKTAAFFRRGGQLNVRDICAEVVDMAPMVGRLDILDLCLRVAGAKGQVTTAEVTMLKDLAGWLQVDRTRLRAMVEKRLPVSMHQTQDEEVILGLTAEMNSDQARHQLNREYAKWSSRVISSDPGIRKQADQMLNLIANARTQYVGAKLPE